MASAPRRSARIESVKLNGAAKMTSQSAAQVVEAAVERREQPTEEVAEESGDELESPLGGKRKRKSSKKDEAAQNKAVKKARMRKGRGVLKEVPNMPLDILLEIFKHLSPQDLLSLGRVSRDFRKLVISKDFKSVWVYSRRQTIGMPEGLDDISEPQYAELTYGNTCLVCGKRGKVVHVWEARTRLCYSCIDDRFVSARYVTRLGLPKTVLDSVPKIYIRGKFTYSPSSAEKLAEEYKALTTDDERDNWEDSRHEHCMTHRYRLGPFLMFQNHLASVERSHKKKEKEARQDKVVKLITSMGYDEKVARAALDDWDIEKLYARNLTDRHLQSAKPKIEKIMPAIEAKVFIRTKKNIIQGRMKLLKLQYAEALLRGYPAAKKYPRVSNIFMIPRIKALVLQLSPETPAVPDFNLTKDTISQVVEEALDIIKDQMVHMIIEAFPDSAVDRSTVLDLAALLFRDPRYGRAGGCSWTVEETIYLSEFEGAVVPILFPRDTLEDTAREVFGEYHWNFASNVALDLEGYRAVCKVLALCGLDGPKTTRDQANKADPIIECIACSDAPEGRLMMKWWNAVVHHTLKHSDATGMSHYSLADGEDTERARQAMRIEGEKFAYGHDLEAECGHCDHISPISQTRKHLLTQHDIVFPRSDDMRLPSIGDRTMLTQCRLWPPRP